VGDVHLRGLQGGLLGAADGTDHRRTGDDGARPGAYDAGVAITYRTLPVPAFDRHTLRIAAGAVTIGVEYRVLDEATILEFYGTDAREKFDHVVPAGMDAAAIQEDGLALHVFATDDGAELLRFDCFDDAPHYHYLTPSEPRNVVEEYDHAANGPILPWALRAIREQLPAMLERAGAPALAAQVDPAVVAAAMGDVEAAVRRMLDAGHPVEV
jgi:hypothetical protein